MTLLLFLCCFIPLFILPKIVFNIFNLPQILALGTLSSLGLILGVSFGNISLVTPSILAIIYLIYITLSLTWTQPIHNGIKEFGLQAPLLILFLVGCTYININNSAIIALGISLSAFLCSIYAFAQTKGIDWFFDNKIKKGGHIKNAIGTIGNTNFLSAYLVSSFWLSIFVCVKISLLFMPISLFIAYVLYLTKSRAGLLGFISGLLFFLIVLGFNNIIPYGIIISHIILLSIIGISILGIYFLIKHWDFFWNSPIDTKKDQVWFATLRYRFCYWLAAWELIKERPLFGWGMWSYRREVYRVQAILNEKIPNFLKPDRYVTPQPRECHNDFIEHLVEFGLVGFLIFMTILVCIFKLGFSYLLINTGTINFYLVLILLSNLIGTIVNSNYFFPLRVPSSALNFWLTCSLIVGITTNNIITFSSNWFFISLLILMCSGFLWNCIIKRFLASYYFSRYGSPNNDYNQASEYLNKVLYYSPNDTLYRTYAMIHYMDVSPETAVHHSTVMLNHYDGMSPLWATLFNCAYARVKDTNIYNLAVYYLKNSLRVLPEGFLPTQELLNEPNNLGRRSRILDARRAIMRKVSEELVFKIKYYESEKKNMQVIAENIQLKANQINMEEQKILNEERVKLNIPNDWIYNVDHGVFISPEEHENMLKQMNGGQENVTE